MSLSSCCRGPASRRRRGQGLPLHRGSVMTPKDVSRGPAGRTLKIPKSQEIHCPLCPARMILIALAMGGLVLYGNAQESKPHRQPGDEDNAARKDGLAALPLPAGLAAQRLRVGKEVRTAAGQRRRLALPDGSTLYVDRNTTVKHDGPRHLHLSAGAIYVEVPPDAMGTGGKPLVVQTAHRQIAG